MIYSNRFEIPVLYEDKYLIVVNKPQGIMVEEGLKGFESVMRLMKKQFAATLRGNNIMQNVHRLDKPVSGALLFARKASIVKLLNEQFANKEISKKYLAIVNGSLPESDGELTNWLLKDDANKKAVIKDHRVQLSVQARLKYMVMAEHEGRSLLEIELITGKYHQIRAQFGHIGRPVIGDDKYGSKEKYKLNAIALHAASLSFKHPIDGNMMTITAPMPEDEVWDTFK